jgi:GTPase SAR1 family protein
MIDNENMPVTILLLGDNGVGKSTICNTYLGLNQTTEYVPTVGLETFKKKHIIPGILY